MPEALKPPYIRKIDTLDGLDVWMVDGAYVRTSIDEEFTNFGQHYRYKYIPENEFWLDKEDKDDEKRFFIDHLLVEHRLMSKGVPYEKAIVQADRVERSERRRAGDIKKLTRNGRKLPDQQACHLKLWKKLENGVSVWIVDGRLVRSVFDIDFTAGGHDHVYEFVPDNEVWIDNDTDDDERPFVLLHELHERNLMAKGMSYSKAHEDSSRLEFRCRHRADEMHDALADEGWS